VNSSRPSMTGIYWLLDLSGPLDLKTQDQTSWSTIRYRQRYGYDRTL
jgi:hypothetical protein